MKSVFLKCSKHGWGLPRWLSIKNPPVKQEMWVGSLSGEDPLEKEMANHSRILLWKIPRATVHRVEKSKTGLSY